MNIDHINISAPAARLPVLHDFYCSVLGLEEGFRPNFGDSGHWLYSGERALVHLSASERHSPSESQGCLDHIAFQTTGLEAMMDRLDTLNIEYRRHFIRDIGMTQLFIKDPVGTGIEINFPGES